MADASERSLSLLRTLSQEHIERNRSEENKENFSQEQHTRSKSNQNRIRKINQSFASALFPNKDHSSSTDPVNNSASTFNSYTNMGNKQSNNSKHNHMDVESRLAYNDYFEDDPSPTRSWFNGNKHKSSLRKNQSISTSMSSGTSHDSIHDIMYDDKSQQYYTLEELVDQDIYTVKQKAGYFAIGFSVLQTVILAVMMIECSVAPLNINREYLLCTSYV